MGYGERKVCPLCRFEFSTNFGIGCLFPQQYKETVQDATTGKLGKKLQNFFAEHEDGALDSAYTTLCCTSCGQLPTEKNLTMYLPINKPPVKIIRNQKSHSFPFTIEKKDYISRTDLDWYYEAYATYDHICENCGGKMRILTEDEDVLCPTCNKSTNENHRRNTMGLRCL